MPGRLGHELPPVAGNNVGDDEEHVGGDQRDAGDVVQAHGQREADQRQAGIGEVQAQAGDAEEDDERGVGPSARREIQGAIR